MRHSWLLAAALLLLPLHGRADGGATLPSSRGGAPEGVRASVRVTWKEHPLPGVRVGWFRALPPEGAAEGEGVTDGSGRAETRLPPGSYYLVALWRGEGGASPPSPPSFASPAPGDRFGYHGGNPVRLFPGAHAEVTLPLAEILPPKGAAPPAGVVSGTVTVDGVPLRDGVVSAYRSGDKAFREIPFATSSPTEGDGAFSLDLPPGRWFLVARRRSGGASAGPLRPGDAFGYFPGNPLLLEEGRGASVSIPAAVRRKGGEGGAPADAASPASIEGRIVGKDGRPRRGLVAVLHDRADRFGRPRFLSAPTGADGRYRLPVAEGGTYWLGARTGYGGAPAPGELAGRRGGADGAITLREGDHLKGLDIVVEEVW